MEGDPHVPSEDSSEEPLSNLKTKPPAYKEKLSNKRKISEPVTKNKRQRRDAKPVEGLY